MEYEREVMKRLLFVCGVLWDVILIVDSLNEYFMCKYMYFVFFCINV